MGDKLEQALAELRQLGQDLDDASALDAETRNARVDAFNSCRERARQALYWLCVQREAMRVMHHDEIFAVYPIPPKRR